VPEGHNLNDLRRRALNAVVEVIANTIKVNPTHSAKPNVACDRADVWLSRDELECLGKILGESFWCFRSVLAPPLAGLFDVSVCARRELDGKTLTHC
jgi:hypothetical protein